MKAEIKKHDWDKPAYFPVLGFMTGPPGFYRNGGLFRWLKIFLLRAEENPLFLSQVLHFIDFGVTRKVLDKWLERPIRSWVREADPGLKPLVFLDSGGFQFLHDANGCLRNHLKSEMGIDVDAGGSYDLQRRMGGDFIVSFDYPLDQRLGRAEAWERCRRSISNAVDLLGRVSAEKGAGRPMPMLAVHGLDGAMASAYTRELFGRIKSLGGGIPRFGLAIGSLVPLAMPASKNYVKILEIVRSVIDSVPEEYRGIPVHALGMSGPVVPLLIYMGVKSFDGASFIVGAKTLSYSAGGAKKRMYDVSEGDIAECGCAYCGLMGEIGLARVREVLKGGESGPVAELAKFDPRGGGEGRDGRSSVYALLAMHNYTAVKRQFEEYCRCGLGRGDPEYLAGQSMNAGRDVSGAVAWLASRDGKLASALGKTHLVLPPPPPDPQPAPEKGSISLALDSESFNVLKTGYRPSGEIALFLPCTPEKPYSASKTHRRVMGKLNASLAGKAQLIEKITLSGLYGPVPQSMENLDPVLRYDYRLRTYDIFNPQKKLVAERLSAFLEMHGRSFRRIIFYSTKEPYRGIFEAAAKAFPASILLPVQCSGMDLGSDRNISGLLRELEAVT